MNDDQNWIQWVVGTGLAAAGLIGGVIRYFSVSLRNEVADMQAEMNERTDRAQKDRDAIWEQIRRLNDDYQKFRGEILLTMVTKLDVAAMEARLLAALAVRDHRAEKE